ncbi:MAG: hypothetical protein ACNI25_08600 [Halarcobacter sp.]
MRLLLTLSLLIFVNVYANDELCQLSPSVLEVDNKVSGMTMDESHKTLLGLTIGKHSFEDLKKYYGEINSFKRKPGCASCDEEACYISRDRSVGVIYYKYAGWDYYGFSITDDSQEINQTHCIETDKLYQGISTKSGLAVGMNRQQISKYLQNPTLATDAKQEYLYEKRLKLPNKQLKIMLQQDIRNKEPINCKYYYYNANGKIEIKFNKKGLIQKLKVIYMEVY